MTVKPRDRPKFRLLTEAGGETVSFGAWLRRQREARDISLREIADSSKISLRYLEAFEQDRFDILPARVFAQGFLREYAKYVGLDPDEVVNHYLASQQEADTEEATGEERAEPKRAGTSSSWWFHVLLVIGVAATLVLAALLAFQTERGRARIAPAEGGTAAATPALPPPAAPREAEPAAPQAVDPAAEPVPEAAQPQAAAPATDPLQVLVRFRERCYVEATVDGERRVRQEQAAGDVLTLPAQQEVLLTLGNAGGVDVEVNGRPFDHGRGRGEVARLRIDLALARSLSEGP